ncbi:MAG: LemA protein, partial [Bermanella sp.]
RPASQPASQPGLSPPQLHIDSYSQPCDTSSHNNSLETPAMAMSSIITLVIAAFLMMYAVTLYNGLVNLKHAVSKYLANIEVLLRQRHDELPKLVETCKQYMQYEQQTLEKVITARSMVAKAQIKGDMKALGQAETTLRAGLGNLFALTENYPDLKADASFQHLQQRISGLENSIADRRESYNEAVNNNNVRIEQFPDVLIARFMNFGAFELLEFSEEALKDVNIKSLFS